MNVPHSARRLLAGLAALLALGLAGCAPMPVGHPFVRPTPDSLPLGRLSVAEAKKQFGPPREERAYSASELSGNSTFAFPFGREQVDGLFRQLYYLYIAPSEPGTGPGIEPSRTLYLWFWNDRLVGYRGHSSFKADSTVFDEQRVATLKAWSSTRKDVLAALGAPSGLATHPLVRGEGNEVLTWDSFEFDRFLNETRRKRLDVLVDPLGTVRDLKFSSSSGPIARPPAPTIITVPTYVPPPVRR